MEELLSRRNLAAEKLLYKYPKYLHVLSENSIITDEEREEAKALLHIVRHEDVTYTALLRYKHLFTKYAAFKHFKVDSLHEMTHFMGFHPVTGLNIINYFLSFFNKKINIDSPYISWLTKLIARR
jgi:hypothetical protein